MQASETGVLRPAAAADGPAVFEIYTHEHVEKFLTFDHVDMDRFRAIYSELLKDGDFFVYEAAGKVVGFCKATRLPGRAAHVAHLGPLAVAPKVHGHGYAAAMLHGVCKQLENAGALRFELMVEADNPRGIAFYRKAGFEQEGIQRKAYKRAGESDYIDELLMVRFADSFAKT